MRKWITPFTAGSFLLAAGTGLLMFFEVRTGFVKPVHEWFTLLFVAGGVLHIVDHWKGIVRHLSQMWGKLFVGGFALLLVLSALPFGAAHQEHGSVRALEKAALDAPLDAIATMLRLPTDSVVRRLEQGGFTKVNARISLNELTGKDREKSARALKLVLGDREREGHGD